MNNYGDLLPAYGRDYKTAKDAKASFLANQDWIISSVQHPYCDKPINLSQIQSDKVKQVILRFDNQRKITAVKIPQATK